MFEIVDLATYVLIKIDVFYALATYFHEYQSPDGFVCGRSKLALATSNLKLGLNFGLNLTLGLNFVTLRSMVLIFGLNCLILLLLASGCGADELPDPLGDREDAQDWAESQRQCTFSQKDESAAATLGPCPGWA